MNRRLLTLDLCSILARDHQVLNGLLLEAKKCYHAAEEHLISVYVSESYVPDHYPHRFRDAVS